MFAEKIVTAERGERMILVKVRFWTNGIGGVTGSGKIVPGSAWGAGVVTVASNAAHGIEGQRPLPFHVMDDLTDVIAEALRRAGVTLKEL